MKRMKPRSEAFLCVSVSIVFAFICILIFAIMPFKIMQPEKYETDKFAQRSSLAIMSVSFICSPLIIWGVWARKLSGIMAWLIIQGILWQFFVILSVVILFSIIRASSASKPPHDSGLFIVCIIIDIVWVLIGYGIWRYWKLLNDIKNFPVFERNNLERQGGKHVEQERVDFESVSLRDFDELAAFGWRRGH